MIATGEQILLRIYLRSADRAPHVPTWQLILVQARMVHMAGATVVKGILGYGAQGLTEPSAWSLVERVPVILEIVDTAAKVAAFMDHRMGELMIGGMATMERASVVLYRHRAAITPAAQTVAPPTVPLSSLPTIQARPNMKFDEDAVLLRAFIGESDRLGGKPLYRAIVERARELGLAGATVLRGSDGFGAHSVVHKAELLEMSTDLPIVIEIVDRPEKIQPMLGELDGMVKEGLVTMEYVRAIHYASRK